MRASFMRRLLVCSHNGAFDATNFYRLLTDFKWIEVRFIESLIKEKGGRFSFLNNNVFSGKFPGEIYSQVTSTARGDRVKILGLERAGGADAGVDVGGVLEGGVAGMFGSVAAVPP